MYLIIFLAIIAIPIAIFIVLRIADHFIAHRMKKAILQKERNYVRSIIPKMIEHYMSAPEFRRGNIAEYQDYDLEFYDGMTNELESLGFHHVGDFEDVVQSRIFPEFRTIYRRFLDAKNLDSACISNIRNWDEKGNVILNVKKYEFGVRFTNDVTLSTTNAGEAAKLYDDTGPYLILNIHPDNTEIPVLLAHHKKHVERYLVQNPGLETTALGTPELLEAAMVRNKLLMSEDRLRKGLFTDSEIDRRFTMFGYGDIDPDIVKRFVEIWKEEHHAVREELKQKIKIFQERFAGKH